MSSTLLDIEVADRHNVKELAVFIDGTLKGYSFRPPERYEPTKKAFCCTKNLHRNVSNSGSLDYSELQNVLLRDGKAEKLAKGREKTNLLSNLMDKEVENLEDHSCAKSQELVPTQQYTSLCRAKGKNVW